MSKFEREVEIDTPIQNAWLVLTDANQWPKWFPYIHSVSNVRPLAEGVVINWSDGKKRHAKLPNSFPKKPSKS